MSAIFQTAAQFLEEIGIHVRVETGACGFLKHMRIEGSTITVAARNDNLVGDLLHEAGHIAVTPSLFRPKLSGNLAAVWKLMEAWFEAHPDAMGWPEDPIWRGILQSGECEAIAWSYAAAHWIGVDTMLPFRRGFEGKGRDVHDMVAAGAHFGVNGLVAGGMTEHPRHGPMFPFPKMKRWMQI